MEVKQKFIFDVDQTLLQGDYSKEKAYFRSLLSLEEYQLFMPQFSSLLLEYEATFQQYDKQQLSDFIYKKTNIIITPMELQQWIEINKDMENVIIPGAFEVLEYLKQKEKEVVVLSNAFSEVQLARLEKTHLLPFIDEVYGGELSLKPHPESYQRACGKTPMESCIMIGDDLEKDILGANGIGLDAIYVGEETKGIKVKKQIKSLIKIKEMY